MSELDRVPDQVLKKAAKLESIPRNTWQIRDKDLSLQLLNVVTHFFSDFFYHLEHIDRFDVKRQMGARESR